MAQVSSITKSILLNPDVDPETGDLDLSKSNFFRYAKERATKVSESVLPELEKIGLSLAEELKVAPPRILIRKLAGDACYNPENHTVSLSKSLPLYAAQSLMHHEFNHIGQDKLKAAAIIAFPDKYDQSAVHQTLLDAAHNQKLDKEPLSVSLGELFLQSSETLIRMERFAYEDGRQHYIDQYKKTYQSSLQEIPARIAQAECMLRISEIEMTLSKKMLTRLESLRASYRLSMDKIWNSYRVKKLINTLVELRGKTQSNFDEDLRLILPKIETGLTKNRNNNFY